MDQKSINMFEHIFNSINQHLNEKQRRLLLGSAAEFLGMGGLKTVCQITNVSKDTVIRGKKEVRGEVKVKEKGVRTSGGGRKKVEDKHPEILDLLAKLVDSSTIGNPESVLQYTSKSLIKLAEELTNQGYKVSDNTVRRLLHKLGFTLQANKKTLGGKKSHLDRDKQFKYINEIANKFMQENQPVISVDINKKELIGQYSNKGSNLEKKGTPEETLDYDFGTNKVVNLVTDKDTAKFSVESIKSWWYKMGHLYYSNANKLMIITDCSGSNGDPVRLWKTELQDLADETGLEIKVCYLPPGTSKWNKIEHRMFSHISMNWRGRPLVEHEVVIKLISSTITKTMIVDDETMTKMNIIKDELQKEWNYNIMPQK